MQFLVQFDGDEETIWLPYSKDLWENTTFAAFCEAHRPLHLLNGLANDASDNLIDNITNCTQQK